MSMKVAFKYLAIPMKVTLWLRFLWEEDAFEPPSYFLQEM